jgi:flagellin-like hook-associated protein FlgL
VGTTSTGSYTRDVLMALSTLGALGSASAGDPQTQSLLGLVHTTLSGADDALNTDIGGLGARQGVVTAAQGELTDAATALTTQLGAVQDADPAVVATQLSTAQTQLQASYKIISDMQQLSLAKYL